MIGPGHHGNTREQSDPAYTGVGTEFPRILLLAVWALVAADCR